MTRVIVDSATQSQLSNARQTLELCSAAGQVLGFFIPRIDPSNAADSEPQISEDELRRRERQGGGRPLAAILADLEIA